MPTTQVSNTQVPTTWQTKYGSRRVRRDPPTLAEAIEAAQGLTDDKEQQIGIAAELMGVSVEEVQSEYRRLQPNRRATLTVAQHGREANTRTVVIERVSRRNVTIPSRPGAAHPQPVVLRPR